ncbi:MAG: hypothetical protein WC472_01640 [Candidatus Paceibacterota bacterium]
MIAVLINTIDRTSQINKNSLNVEQVLTSEVNSATFIYKKYGTRTYVPTIGDEVIIYDGTTKIFGGYIASFDEESVSNGEGIEYSIQCNDYSSKLSGILVSKSFENKTIAQVIADLYSVYAPAGFTANNVIGTFTMGKIVFNEVYFTDVLKQLAEVVKYEWYIDEDKDLHFFPKLTNMAPFNLTDTSGNYIVETLKRKIDGTQIVNQVKVRGGEGDGTTYADIITIYGVDTKTVSLPYKFSNLVVKVNNVIKTVGVDYLDDPTTKDCLYNYQESTIRFPSTLANGDKVYFSGNPKIPIKSIIKNAGAIAQYGVKEKIINDSNIIDMTTARNRAKAELMAFKDANNEATFETYTAGLHTGMIIGLSSTKRNSNNSYIIRKISFKPRTENTFVYLVEIITASKYNLIDLLQKLIAPINPSLNDSEIAETIYTDITDISIGELITAVSPFLDSTPIVVGENVQRDPLGAGVEPIWVLGPYSPTGITDTKRQGLLDVSLKVY